MPITGPSMNIFGIASSAMTAQSQRMNVTASNMANADSIAGPDGKPYRAKQVVFQVASPEGTEVGGVKVSEVVEDGSPLRDIYDPKNPRANAQGYVQMPNVSVVQEMTNMISASRSYEANVEVLNTAKTLMVKTLSIGQ